MKLEYERFGSYVVATMHGQAVEFAEFLTALQKQTAPPVEEPKVTEDEIKRFIHTVMISMDGKEGEGL